QQPERHPGRAVPGRAGQGGRHPGHRDHRDAHPGHRPVPGLADRAAGRPARRARPGDGTMTIVTGEGLEQATPLGEDPAREPGAGQAPPPAFAEGTGIRRAVAGAPVPGAGAPDAPSTAARSAATSDTNTPGAAAAETAARSPVASDTATAGS